VLRSRVRIVALVAAVSAHADRVADRTTDAASIQLRCAAVAQGLECRLDAVSTDVARPAEDVTRRAAWQVRSSRAVTSSVGRTMVAGGDGDIEIEARYGVRSARAMARLAPGRPAQLLAAIDGHSYVSEAGSLRPIAGVHIEVVEGPNAGLTTRTGPDSSFALRRLVPGDVTIRATKPGYLSADVSAEIGAGENRVNVLVTREHRPFFVAATTTTRSSGTR